MPASQILLEQLTDPFRIALIVGLVYTMYRTRAQTGTLVPLAAGVLFVAVMLPMTMGTGEGRSMGQAVGLGLVANLGILAVVMGVWQAVLRLRR